MHECGLCNGWGETERSCPRCEGVMKDQGRVTDFFDEYSPYLDLTCTDLVDGAVDSSVQNECVHLFVCGSCGLQDIQTT